MQATPCFLVLAHTDPCLCGRLANALGPNHDVFVHVDAKSDIRPFLEQRVHSRVAFINERVRVSWAGFSMVRATLQLIRAALLQCPSCTHLVLLSGQDYPIKPLDTFLHHLAASPSRQFMKLGVMNTPARNPQNYRITRYSFLDQLALIPSSSLRTWAKVGIKAFTYAFRRKPISGLEPFFGSQWWAITPACARHVVNSVKSHREFVDFCRYSFCPDEHFFHTIVGNSPFVDGCEVVYDYPAENETVKAVSYLANLHLVDRRLSHFFDDRDFSLIQDSDKFFVRKVTSNASRKLLDLVDAQILHK